MVEPDYPPEMTDEEVSQGAYRYQVNLAGLWALVEEHAQEEALADRTPRPRGYADQASDLENLARKMNDLREALRNFPDDTKWRTWFLKVILGYKGKDLEVIYTEPPFPPILPEFQDRLEEMSNYLLEHAASMDIKQGSRAPSPDRILISKCLWWAHNRGQSKNKGLELARLAYWASTGGDPSQDWGVRQVKATTTKGTTTKGTNLPRLIQGLSVPR